jgi:1-deoxy-D-xylulose-5-phosphate synthase
LLASKNIQVPLLQLGLPDEFLEHASREQLLTEAGIDAAGVRAAIFKRWPQLTPNPLSEVRSAV